MVKVSNSTFEQRLKNLSDRRTDLEHLPCSSFYDHDSFDKEIRSIPFDAGNCLKLERGMNHTVYDKILSGFLSARRGKNRNSEKRRHGKSPMARPRKKYESLDMWWPCNSSQKACLNTVKLRINEMQCN